MNKKQLIVTWIMESFFNMNIFQWIIWIIGLLVFISLFVGIRRDAKRGMPVHISLLIQTILLLVAVVLFIFLPCNKFHLLWVIPVCLVLGWLIGFIFIPMPIIGDYLFRNISLIFAYILLAGTDWELGGYPWEISTMRAIRKQPEKVKKKLEKLDKKQKK